MFGFTFKSFSINYVTKATTSSFSQNQFSFQHENLLCIQTCTKCMITLYLNAWCFKKGPGIQDPLWSLNSPFTKMRMNLQRKVLELKKNQRWKRGFLLSPTFIYLSETVENKGNVLKYWWLNLHVCRIGYMLF